LKIRYNKKIVYWLIININKTHITITEWYSDIWYFEYSPDNKGFVFIAEKEWKWAIVKDGKESNKYDDIGDFKYSSDNKGFVFIAEKEW